jgi:outer membrane lipoprotein SlyB
MEAIKKNVEKLKSNPLGAALGAGAGYLAATKLIKTEKLWLKIVSAIAGAVVGAVVQAKMKAKKGVPTIATVAK